MGHRLGSPIFQETLVFMFMFLAHDLKVQEHRSTQSYCRFWIYLLKYMTRHDIIN